MLAGIVVDIAMQLDSLQLGVCMRLCDTFQHTHTDKALWVVECNTQGRGTFLVLTLNQPWTHKCVHCIHKPAILYYVGFNTRRYMFIHIFCLYMGGVERVNM